MVDRLEAHGKWCDHRDLGSATAAPMWLPSARAMIRVIHAMTMSLAPEWGHYGSGSTPSRPAKSRRPRAMSKRIKKPGDDGGARNQGAVNPMGRVGKDGRIAKTSRCWCSISGAARSKAETIRHEARQGLAMGAAIFISCATGKDAEGDAAVVIKGRTRRTGRQGGVRGRREGS